MAAQLPIEVRCLGVLIDVESFDGEAFEKFVPARLSLSNIAPSVNVHDD